ncbi:uncharacterized protein LOC127255352 isoform X2 [Andrographis paniculata]|uniref:uncharacterized protein LOC127255352 isoform X2 n=1 Tax=Andrographis paniculata TaxID=175694 RepID=UPI0021E75909|nr:uncharacterized protein LOC127255352 isoform X2 [Andrographis paniculata]
MPGPGPHTIYALGSGQALMYASGGRFGPHHCVTYAINAFFGPDMGSFADWLSSFSPGSGRVLGSSVEHWIHHPFYYPLILSLPLSLLYSRLSRLLLRKGILSGAALNLRQCILLISAGSLSHFFLDHLFEENGHTSMYTWILSTGWWETRASINLDSVVVISILCTVLIGGFIYIHRLKSEHRKSMKLIVAVAGAYCLWCASQIYVVVPRRPAVGEEADLGVLVFLAVFYFLPHWFCIMSMNPAADSTRHLPL